MNDAPRLKWSRANGTYHPIVGYSHRTKQTWWRVTLDGVSGESFDTLRSAKASRFSYA